MTHKHFLPLCKIGWVQPNKSQWDHGVFVPPSFTPCSRHLEYLRLLGKGSVGSFCATACWCVWHKKKRKALKYLIFRQKCTREHSISPQDWVLDIQLNIKRWNFRIPNPGRQCNPSLSAFLERKIPRGGVLLLRGLRPSLFYLTTNLCATVE